MPTVDLHEALTPVEAQALAEWLGHRGIATQLIPHADTAFGKLMAHGSAWGVIRVDQADAERAREAITEWRSLRADPEVLAEDAKARPEQPASESAQSRGAGVIRAAWKVARPLLLATSLTLNVLLFWRMYQPVDPTSAVDADGAVIAEYFASGGALYPHRIVSHDKRGAIAESIDADEDGRPELVHDLARDGQRVATHYDADQNGQFERRIDLDRGQVIATWEDRDGDHLFEQGTFQPGDRPGARWLDLNQDGITDRFELAPGSSPPFALIDSDRDGMPDQIECGGTPARPLILCAR